MNNNPKNLLSRLLLALTVSLSLHFIVLSKFGFLVSGSGVPTRGPLQISLLAPAPAVPETAPTEKPAATVPDAASRPPRPQIPARQRVRASTPVAPAMPPEPVMAVAPATPARPAMSDLSAGIPFPGQTEALQHVEIAFQIYGGAERRLVGTGKHLYISDNHEYFSVSAQQTAIDAPDQPASWRLEISGRITRQGLSPLLYETQGALADRLLGLQGAADSAVSDSATARKGRYRDGLLDRQSLLYQFMVRPPDALGGKLWLTDGVHSEIYSYRFAGLDSTNIGTLGEVRSVKLSLSGSESGETIELWLVPELHYLPVKVRYTDKTGAVIEQLATAIDFK